MVFRSKRKLLKTIDNMLDEAIDGNYDPKSYDESMLSKVEFKMSRFLEIQQEKNRELMKNKEIINSLISDISHQTKTPITNIKLYTQLLLEKNLDDESKNLAVEIEESGEKLDFLVNSLVKTSRLESGIIKVTNKATKVMDLVNNAVFATESFAKEKDITIKINLSEEDKDVMADFDLKWCTEALINILDNGIKYTKTGDEINIDISAYEMYVRVDITDQGIGIKEEELTKVFGRFWRSSEVSRLDGVGIGLYLAREIIIACNGYIKVASEKDKWTTFSVFLTKV